MESIWSGVVLFEPYTSFKTRSSITLCQNKRGHGEKCWTIFWCFIIKVDSHSKPFLTMGHGNNFEHNVWVCDHAQDDHWQWMWWQFKSFVWYWHWTSTKKRIHIYNLQTRHKRNWNINKHFAWVFCDGHWKATKSFIKKVGGSKERKGNSQRASNKKKGIHK